MNRPLRSHGGRPVVRCMVGLLWIASASASEQQSWGESDLVALNIQEPDSVTTIEELDFFEDKQLEVIDTLVSPMNGLRDVELWPFNDKNKTHENNSCAVHTSCLECSSSSSTCHWCAHDQACHAVGSVYGCLSGVDCVNHTKPEKKDKNETSCAAHSTCSDCALASTLCHWCAHDQACHAFGSVYGCLTGVNCYSNDRCERKEPEPVTKIVFAEMGILPMLAIFFLGGVCLCCSTLGYCVAGGVKGAYDDLAAIAAQSARPVFAMRAPVVQPLRDEETAICQGDPVEDGNNQESAPLIPLHETVHEDYVIMTDADQRFQTTPSSRATSRHMQCLFHACTLCYVISLAAIAGFVLGSIRYFPKIPEYNICNDAMAWKSLVDSMTSMKVEANIEILVSVMNPNHFDVALDMGQGTFKHDGAFVGRFEIPPSQAKAMSITDMMILATFTPEKWEALSLTAEYYKGTLVLQVDSQASIRVPGLANYTYEADFANMLVHVNDPKLSDRHLCACPQWKDSTKNKTMLS